MAFVESGQHASVVSHGLRLGGRARCDSGEAKARMNPGRTAIDPAKKNEVAPNMNHEKFESGI